MTPPTRLLRGGTCDNSIKRRKGEAPTLCEHVKAIIADRNEKRETLYTPQFRRLTDSELQVPSNGAVAGADLLRCGSPVMVTCAGDLGSWRLATSAADSVLVLVVARVQMVLPLPLTPRLQRGQLLSGGADGTLCVLMQTRSALGCRLIIYSSSTPARSCWQVPGTQTGGVTHGGAWLAGTRVRRQ